MERDCSRKDGAVERRDRVRFPFRRWLRAGARETNSESRERRSRRDPRGPSARPGRTETRSVRAGRRTEKTELRSSEEAVR